MRGIPILQESLDEPELIFLSEDGRRIQSKQITQGCLELMRGDLVQGGPVPIHDASAADELHADGMPY